MRCSMCFERHKQGLCAFWQAGSLVARDQSFVVADQQRERSSGEKRADKMLECSMQRPWRCYSVLREVATYKEPVMQKRGRDRSEQFRSERSDEDLSICTRLKGRRLMHTKIAHLVVRRQTGQERLRAMACCKHRRQPTCAIAQPAPSHRSQRRRTWPHNVDVSSSHVSKQMPQGIGQGHWPVGFAIGLLLYEAVAISRKAVWMVVRAVVLVGRIRPFA